MTRLTLGQRLRARREALRDQQARSGRPEYSRAAVAKRAQISEATLRNIEMGRHVPTPPVLAAVAAVLGLRLSDLLEQRLPGESVVDAALRVRQTTLGRLRRPAEEQEADVALLRRRLSGWRPSEPGQEAFDEAVRRFIELVVAAADPPPEAP